MLLLLSDIHGGGAVRAAGALQRGGSPFSLLTNSFDRSSSYGTLQGRAASSSVQRYSYWQVWISWRLHRRVWNWFLPNMAEVWVSNLLLLILYLSCCEHGQQQIAVRLCSAGYVCLFGHGFDYWPSNTFFDLHSIWARKIGCISMSRRQPKAHKKKV